MTMTRKKRRKVRFAYRVAIHMFNDIRIERLEITRVTKDKVTYINAYGVEFTQDKRGASYRWFPVLEKAQMHALKVVKDRIEFYHGVIANLEHCATLARRGKIMVGVDQKMVDGKARSASSKTP